MTKLKIYIYIKFLHCLFITTLADGFWWLQKPALQNFMLGLRV